MSEHEAAVQFEQEHAQEIAAEHGKGFELVDAAEEEKARLELPVAAEAAAPAVIAEEVERISPLQKISRLSVGERVKLAFLGNKEERAILIRDGSRIVSSAVMSSPKLTEQEIENIAGMKNVQESVLRDIARSRKFMKSTVVVRNLVNNPRCPLDISLNLVKRLIVTDLNLLSKNKGIPETLRKVANKALKEKQGPQR